MSTILTTIGDVINAIFVGTPASEGVPAVPSWISTVISTITSQPILLFVVLLPFIGIGVSLLRRLFSTKA